MDLLPSLRNQRLISALVGTRQGIVASHIEYNQLRPRCAPGNRLLAECLGAREPLARADD